VRKIHGARSVTLDAEPVTITPAKAAAAGRLGAVRASTSTKPPSQTPDKPARTRSANPPTRSRVRGTGSPVTRIQSRPGVMPPA
jgi:hypothetical protein